jgi:hypothetical protein
MSSMMVTNSEFLTALFGDDAAWVHVTDFPYDPGNIPKDKHLIAWMGDYFSRYHMQPGSNQYFTISNFYCDDENQARRRKALFRHTPVIVLDDVKEKLSMDEVSKLPRPSWVLETSQGSEQWGYILNTPCTDRARVENLLDGLVANGLAPDGKDPGMKGVTRYVRLPEGSNNKASKLVNGLPYKCQLTLWEPFSRVTIEQLAEPFHVDLDAVRRESRIDGAAAVSDHPLINIPEIIHVKEVRSDGRFDITCPWVNEHTGADDSGSAVFTNADGSIGFKCHHGACQHRTGRDLIRFIDGLSAGFSGTLKNWQILREFAAVAEPSFLAPVVAVEQVSFMSPAPTTVPSAAQVSFLEPVPTVQPIDAIQMLMDKLRLVNPRTPEAREHATNVLKYTDDLPKLDKMQWHNEVCDAMGWGKGEFKEILKDLRQQWYTDKSGSAEFYDDVVYVKELNQFYDWKSRIFFTTDAFQNSFSHEDAEARKIALQDGRVKKVDRLDYAPKHPRIFNENGTLYANTWTEVTQDYGAKGDIVRWEQHFEVMGWGEHLKHIKQWLAHTLRHPDVKINHMLMLGSGEGAGKDYLLYPLTKAMGENYTVISGEELLTGFNDYVLSTKYLHINEAELGDRREAMAVSNKLKPLAAAPPDTLRVNQKGIKAIDVRNILSTSMTTNSMMPIRLNGPSRRIFGLWSDLNIRDADDNMKPEWLDYWNDRWDWMKQGGWKAVAYHLMYEVDLSDFNPAEAPPMTDFLRDIKEASKSPMQQTIETFIQKQHGVFKCDLVTASDMSDTLRSGGIFAPNDMYVDSKYFTPTKTGMVIKEIGRYTQVKTYHLGTRVMLWVLRSDLKYNSMDSNALYQEYERQLAEVRGELTMQVVN